MSEVYRASDVEPVVGELVLALIDILELVGDCHDCVTLKFHRLSPTTQRVVMQLDFFKGMMGL